MTPAEYTFDELLPYGWHDRWLPDDGSDQPFVVEFTVYRSEVARHSLVARGRTVDEAKVEAARMASAWIAAHPEFTPRPR